MPCLVVPNYRKQLIMDFELLNKYLRGEASERRETTNKRASRILGRTWSVDPAERWH